MQSKDQDDRCMKILYGLTNMHNTAPQSFAAAVREIMERDADFAEFMERLAKVNNQRSSKRNPD
jgi:hypothetical protein